MDDELLLNIKTSSKPIKPLKPSKPLKSSQNKPTTREKSEKYKKKPEFGKIIGEKEKISSLFAKNTIATQKSIIKPTCQPIPSEKPKEIYTINSWNDLKLHPALISQLIRFYEKPTKIQTLTIPKLLTDQTSTLIQANTGSGKTLAYLLPILDRLMSIKDSLASRTSGVFSIILAPTRELALQIFQVCEKILNMKNTQRKEDGYLHHWITPGLFVGNNVDSRKSEKARFRKGMNIVIGTPGRILDHLQKTESFIQSLDVKWFVIDEADRVMELGMEDSVRQIVEILDKITQIRLSDNLYYESFKLKVLKRSVEWDEHLPKERQNVLCSATISTIDKVDGLAVKLIGLEPLKIFDQEQVEGDLSLPPQLRQRYVPTPTKLRLVTLISLLKRSVKKDAKIMVFVNTREEVDFLWQLLGSCPGEIKQDLKLKSTMIPGTEIYRLHGAMPQSLRTSTYLSLSKPSSDLIPILITTDVSSRGIDLIVSDVIHFTPPATLQDYIHRCGRTARLGREGESIWCIDLEEVNRGAIDWIRQGTGEKSMDSGLILLEDLKKIDKWDNETVETALLPLLSYLGSQKMNILAAMDVQLMIERWVLKDATLARAAFLSHVKAYGAYPKNIRNIFSVKHLHLGHVCKSFGLRESPQEVVVKSGSSDLNHVFKETKRQHEDSVNKEKEVKKRKVYDEWDLVNGEEKGVKRLLTQGPRAGKKKRR